MIILGIETSCDETAAAVLEQSNGRIQILSNVVSSSLSLHAKYGGVIPEQAAREQLKLIIPVIESALSQAFPNYRLSSTNYPPIDAIAVTQGPGLIGSLLVGVETTKTLALIWQKPLIPINHLIGHFYANWVARGGQHTPIFPCIGLLVSGGHTDLVLFKDHNKFDYLGGTRDDAAGECFDKCARILGFAYPGGPKISKLAAMGKPTFDLPTPMQDSKDFDFSFSGLKTAFANLFKQNFKIAPGKFDPQTQTWVQKPLEEQLTKNELTKIHDLCTSLENTIINFLVIKTVSAIKKYKIEQLMVAGGVAANQKLGSELRVKSEELGVQLYIPPADLCTDNAAMIAAAAFFTTQQIDPLSLQANPNLSLAY